MNKEKHPARLVYEANCNRKRTRLATGIAITSGVACVRPMSEGNISGMQTFLGVTGAALLTALISSEVGHRKMRRVLESPQLPSLKEPVKKGHFVTRRSLYRCLSVA